MNRMQRYMEKLKKYCADSSYRFVVNAALGLYNSMPDRDYLERKFEALMGTPLHLEYYLLNDSVLGGCAECYGVEILAQTGEAQCYAGIPRITMRGTRIFTLIDQLAYFAVTPDSLNDVIQDWL